MPERSRELRQSMIDELVNGIESCTICRDTPLKSPLPHEPRPVVRMSATARLAVAGQAPGLRVHESGIPFNDRSGDRLRDWMGIEPEIFYDRSKIAIVPMGFCFPGYDKHGSDLPPRKECAPKWRQAIFELMPQLELVLLIGGYAQDWHLGAAKRRTMTETVANWGEFIAQSEGPSFLPLPHPSWRNTGWLRKNPWFEDEVLPYLRDCVQRLT